MFKKNRCYDMSNNMMWQQAMPQMSNDYLVNMPVDPNFDMNKDGVVNKADLKMAKKGMCAPDMMPGCKMQPVYECPVEKCVHRTICHEVPQE